MLHSTVDTTLDAIHQPLDPSSNKFRILTLQKGTWSDEITCSLRVVSLEYAKGHYRALSYRWGDGNDMEQITVDGKVLNVTTTLHSALKHLRLDSTDRDLWIDQICVNQDDPYEKQHQISLMKPIYAESAEVIIWLGESDKHSDRLADMLSTANLSRLSKPPAPGTEEAFGKDIQILYNLILHICLREWWSRVWIVQECVLPVKPPVFMCGDSTFTFSQLGTAFDAIMSVPQYTAYLDNTSSGDDAALREALKATEKSATDLLQPLVVMMSLRATLASAEKRTISLIDCLQLTVCRSTSIPHDHVYGFLGLVSSDESEELLGLGTDISAAQLFHKLMVLALGQGAKEDTLGCYQALALIAFNADSYGNRAVPSWVPDLSAQSFSNRGNSVYLVPSEPAETRFKPDISFDPDGLMMRMVGFHLDTITHIKTLPPERLELPGGIENCQEQIMKLYRSSVPLFHRLSIFRDSPKQPPGISFRRLFTCNYQSELFTDQSEALEKLWELWIRSEKGHSRSSRKELEKIRQSMGAATVQDIFDEFLERTSAASQGRQWFGTKDRYIGITGKCHVGDVVVLPRGFVMPLILRPVLGNYHIIGGAYIDGLIEDGAIDRLVDERDLTERTWKIC